MAVLEELRKGVRAGTFDDHGLDPPKEGAALTFAQFVGSVRTAKVLSRVGQTRTRQNGLKTRLEPNLTF